MAATDMDANGDGDAGVNDPARSAISEEEVSALLEKRAAETAVPFDLSARRVSRTQLPMLDFLCRNFAERAGGTLSGLLSREIAMQFDGLDSQQAGDLTAALPQPAAIAVVRMKPLPAAAFVNVEPALLLALLDGFFGGSGRASTGTEAAAAPAAQRFLALMIRTLGADVIAAWTPIAAVEWEPLRQETNSRFVQLGEARDMLIVARFTVTYGEQAGRLELLLPEALLAPVREALASDGGRPAARPQAPWAPVLTAALQRAELEARAVLGEAQISLGELVRLVPGDIVPIESPQQVVLFAGGVPLYRGKFGVSKGRNALKIVSRGAT
jgi:flagellar motor switch protein FliM